MAGKTAHWSPDGLREYGQDVDQVWGEWADSDVIALANAATAALNALANRIERGE